MGKSHRPFLNSDLLNTKGNLKYHNTTPTTTNPTFTYTVETAGNYLLIYSGQNNATDIGVWMNLKVNNSQLMFRHYGTGHYTTNLTYVMKDIRAGDVISLEITNANMGLADSSGNKYVPCFAVIKIQ